MRHALGASVGTAVQSKCGLGQGQSKDPGPRPGSKVGAAADEDAEGQRGPLA